MSKKQQMDPIEENQVKLVMRTADLIKSSIRMACLMQQAARMNPEDIISTIVMGVGDFIMEFTDSPECRKELLNVLPSTWSITSTMQIIQIRRGIDGETNNRRNDTGGGEILLPAGV